VHGNRHAPDFARWQMNVPLRSSRHASFTRAGMER
jgi:hypothetical protein